MLSCAPGEQFWGMCGGVEEILLPSFHLSFAAQVCVYCQIDNNAHLLFKSRLMKPRNVLKMALMLLT